MALRIRLRRMGRKKAPTYRIVVAEASMPRDGRFVDTLGHYNPRTDPLTLVVNQDRARHWLKVGAKPTDTVHALLRRAGVYRPQPEAGVVGTVVEAAQSAGQKVAELASGAAAAVAGAVAGAAETVQEAAASAVETVQEAVGTAAEESAESATEEPAADVVQVVEEQPEAAGAATEPQAAAEAEEPAAGADEERPE